MEYTLEQIESLFVQANEILNARLPLGAKMPQDLTQEQLDALRADPFSQMCKNRTVVNMASDVIMLMATVVHNGRDPHGIMASAITTAMQYGYEMGLLASKASKDLDELEALYRLTPSETFPGEPTE